MSNNEFDLNDYADDFAQAEQKYNLPTGLLYQVAKQETGGQDDPPNAVSDAGAQGLMQIMPDTSKSLNVDPFIPSDAINGSARLLRENLDRYKNVPDALRAYNSGTDKSKWNNKETNGYVANITAGLPGIVNNVKITPTSGSEDPLTQSASQVNSDDPLMAAAAQIKNSPPPPADDDPLMAAAQEVKSGISSPDIAPVPSLSNKTPLSSSAVTGSKANNDSANKDAPISTSQDVAESIPSGLVKGVNEITKVPVGIANLVMQTGQQAANKLYNAFADKKLTQEQQDALIRKAGSNINDYVPTISQVGALADAVVSKSLGNSGQNISYADLAHEALNGTDNSPVLNALHEPVTPEGKTAESIAKNVPSGLIGGLAPATAIGASALSTAAAPYIQDNPIAQLGVGIAGAGLGKATGAVLGKTYNAVRGAEPSSPPIADNVLTKAIQNSRDTPSNVEAKLNSMGDHAMLADAGGEATRDVATAIANMPGPAKEIAVKALEERQVGQTDRIQQAALTGLKVDPEADYHGTTDDLLAKRATDSAPLYEKALQGGSITPLEKQFEQSFNDADKAKSDASQAVYDAQQKLTLAKAMQQRAGNNVYNTSHANSAIKEAQSDLDKAKSQQQEARKNLDDVTGTLRQAQADRASGAKGAVWSPRIQQFLDDPIMKQGLRQGLEIQRLESLAQGKKFNPSEYGITGTDESGNPVVSKVPNMRLLDAGKRGLDSIIEEYRDPTGKLNLDQRGRAVNAVKQSYVKELDSINPDYKAAREAYAGPSQSKDAMDLGRRFMLNDSSVNEKIVSRLSDSDKGFFRLGVGQQISDMLQKAPDAADSVKRIFGSPAKRAKLASVFPDAKSFHNFENVINNEKEFTKTYQAALSGSRTTPLREKIDNLRSEANSNIASRVQSGIGHTIELGKRNLVGKIIYGAGHGLNKLTQPREFPQSEAIALANKLFTPNTERGGIFPVKESTQENLLSSYIKGLARVNGLVANPSLSAPRITYNPINNPQQNP